MFRTGSGAGACAAMADSKVFWRDDEIVVDRDGVPHFTGQKPELMKEYRRRVLFAFNNLEGSGDDETKEARSLKKKKARFAKRLIDSLHGEAWRACQDLLNDSTKLRAEDGYKHVFAALQSIEKVGVIKKTEAFDSFFDRCYRRRGQSMDSFLRMRRESWSDLMDLADGVTMSEDLLAYFLLRNAGLSREDRRQILLSNQSDYSLEGIEKSLRISYFDAHEKEKAPGWNHSPGKKGGKGAGRGFGGKRGYAHAAHEEDDDYDEDEAVGEDETEDYYALAAEADEEDANEEPEEISDAGASGDEAIFTAYATYQESRRKLRDLQKSRGLLRPKEPGQSGDERRAQINKEKQRTRCSVCNRLGHWAGDAACPKKGAPGGRFGQSRGRGPKGRGRGSKGGKAYVVSESPLFFSLGDDGLEDQFCNMVRPEQADSEDEMPQDSGRTYLDERRKQGYTAEGSDWEYVPPAFPSEAHVLGPLPVAGEAKEDTVQMVFAVDKKNVEDIPVTSLAQARPERLEELRLRELQSDCDRWGIAVSGSKAEVIARLQHFYSGGYVKKKGSANKFVRLREVRNLAGPTSSTTTARVREPGLGSTTAAAAPPKGAKAKSATREKTRTRRPPYISKLPGDAGGDDRSEDGARGAVWHGGGPSGPGDYLCGLPVRHGASPASRWHSFLLWLQQLCLCTVLPVCIQPGRRTTYPGGDPTWSIFRGPTALGRRRRPKQRGFHPLPRKLSLQPRWWKHAQRIRRTFAVNLPSRFGV